MSKCTCGKCIGGVLSPRIVYRMTLNANQAAELIRDSMPDFPGGQPMHDPEVLLLDFTPPEVRMEVHPDFVKGFANCFDVIAYLLKQQQLPKPRVVQQCSGIVAGLDKAATSFYFDNNGTAEYVLDALLARVAEEIQGGTEDDADKEAIAALPECHCDKDIEILRQQLFCTSDFWPCGPYPMDDEGGADEAGDDGWVHYDTSNWKPPAPKS